MVPFAGYEMPVQYADGIIKEHLHTRTSASLFDVSHMGQIVLRSRSGRPQDATFALESIVPADVLNLANGRQRYAVFTNDSGGVRDDLMIGNLGDHLLLIVNAACKDADETHLRHSLPNCLVEPLRDRALLALQGPASQLVLAELAREVIEMRFMDLRPVVLLGTDCLVSRSGYTGEDGFEISVPGSDAEAVAAKLLEHPQVKPAGLGARDSLRLEAGLCLYGSDLGPTTTPVEAGLDWTIQKSRRSAGARPGGFPGAKTILHQLSHGSDRKRVGLRVDGRALARHGAELYRDEALQVRIGSVTSGGFSPTLQSPIAMGYVPVTDAEAGSEVFASVRSQPLPMHVTRLPFVPTTYKRS
jgi:glycine cleavage system T protein (aminomethyltransferase)